MKYLLVATAILLSGCTTVPVAVKFPDPPGRLATVPCPNLQKLNDDAKLSDVSRTITVNYTTYHECAIKLEAWQEWYEEQKLIFKNAR